MTAMDVDQSNNATAMEVDEENAEHPSDEIFKQLLAKAKALEAGNADGAIKAYRDIIFNKNEDDDPTARGREHAIGALADFMVTRKEAAEISKLSKELRPIFSDLPKAKTAKIVRNLIDAMAKIPGSSSLQVEMCRDCIEWCKGEKRTFLRQRVETRLAALLLTEKNYAEALDILTKLLAEVKKLDDKMLLVEIHLIECRTHYALQNTPKSKAALTASKTNANAIHCPPLLQADIDLWSGIVTAREKDFRTAYSYFYEAFEAYNAADKHEKARSSMKYMLLTKIMYNRPEDTASLINSKTGLKYTGIDIDAMAAVAKAHQDRSLKKFEAVREQFKAQLDGDDVIAGHLSDLNETLLEQNVLRILEPFSHVEIDHVAELLELPLERTQGKLREMILDQKLNGTLDQGVGVLIVFDQEKVQSTYDNALKTIKNTSQVLDTLYGIAKQVA
jgi:26S proteasome regulatory subunit N6